MAFDLLPLRHWGMGHSLYAIWEGETHVGQIEVLQVEKKITRIYALGINYALRGRGFGRRVINEIVNNPKVKVLNIEPSAKGFWQKVLPGSSAKQQHTPSWAEGG